jgi:alpha-tubulin suppressor-like RCC1 family protein
LVTEGGQIFSFGGGRDGQLGYGNLFNDEHPKGGVTQYTPRQVTPSGVHYVDRTDMKVAQVACGATFSVAREVCPEEGVDMRRGLRQAEQALLSLGKLYKNCDTLQRAYAAVRQERFAAGEVSRGAVTTWGSGERGELGLGPDTYYSPAPTVLSKLQHYQVIQIAAGHDHVLARSTTGQLFTWGSGRNGKLGHGDFADRPTPEMVGFYRLFNVEHCSAGDNHSAVLITNRRSTVARGEQIRQVSCFGRGAHGRLGHGSNRNSPTPVVVSKWLPSIDGWQVRQVACGGAHTVVLLERAVPHGIANPWGMETAVAAFGYGTNGQLGNGYTADSFLPVKARMPLNAVVAEVSAGRSWSMARTICGSLYSWGMGLRGQLGQGGGRKFSVSPEKVDTWGSFVNIEGVGHAHNVCLVSRRKFLNESLLTTVVKESRRALHGGSSISQDAGAFGHGNVFAPLVNASLRQHPSDSLYSFHCCRSNLGDTHSHLRFACKDCGINCICHTCAKLCHAGHTIISRNFLLELEASSQPPTHSASKKTQYQQRRQAEAEARRPKDVVKTLNRRQLNKIVWRNNTGSFEQPELPPPCGLEGKVRSVFEAVKRNQAAEAAAIAMTASSESKDGRQRTHRTQRSRQPDSDGDSSVDRLPPRPPQAAAGTEDPHSDTEQHLDPLNDEGEVHYYVGGGGEGGGGGGGTQRSRRRRRVLTCRCGLFNQRCRVLPTIVEDSTNDVFEDPTGVAWVFKRMHVAARVIQRACRRLVLGRKEMIAAQRYAFMRRVVCRDYWMDTVIGSMFEKVAICQDMHREGEERGAMAHEELLTRRFDQYFKLQLGLSSMDALVFAVRRFYGKLSILAPRMREHVMAVRPESKESRFRPKFAKGPGPSAATSRAASPEGPRPTTPQRPISASASASASKLSPGRQASTALVVSGSPDGRRSSPQSRPASRQQSAPPAPVFDMSTLDASTEMHPQALMEASDTRRPTFAFSWGSLRAQQLLKPEHSRLPLGATFKATLGFPRYSSHEGRVADPDVNLFLRVHLRDARTEQWRSARGVRVARGVAEEERIRARRRADIVAKRKAQRTYLFGKAAAIMEGAGHLYADEALQQARLLHRERVRSEKEEQVVRDKAVTLKAQDLEDSTFEQQYNVDKDPLCGAPEPQPIRRRHSIGDPCCMYGRIAILMLPALKRRAKAKRRLSEPYPLHKYHPTPFPKPPYVAQIKKSLNLFQQRTRILNGFLDPRFEATWASVARPVRLKRMQRALAYAWLNPRLPPEMMTMLRHGKRRRTVGEPERLSRQLFLMFETRNAFMRLRLRSRLTDRVVQRRRSFDLGEERDDRDDITHSIGYAYEDAYVTPSLYDLRMDAVEMRSRMVYSGFDEDEEIDARTGKRVKKSKRKKLGQEQPKESASASRSAASMAQRDAGKEGRGRTSTGGVGGKSLEELEADELLRLRGMLQNDPLRFKRGMHKRADGDEGDDGKAVGGGEGPQAEVWQEHFSPDDGAVYYYHPDTGESSWEVPVGDKVQIVSQLQDASGEWYWI